MLLNNEHIKNQRQDRKGDGSSGSNMKDSVISSLLIYLADHKSFWKFELHIVKPRQSKNVARAVQVGAQNMLAEITSHFIVTESNPRLYKLRSREDTEP